MALRLRNVQRKRVHSHSLCPNSILVAFRDTTLMPFLIYTRARTQYSPLYVVNLPRRCLKFRYCARIGVRHLETRTFRRASSGDRGTNVPEGQRREWKSRCGTEHVVGGAVRHCQCSIIRAIGDIPGTGTGPVGSPRQADMTAAVLYVTGLIPDSN
jgi:hypothetical protein